jgi:hypothetical protein
LVSLIGEAREIVDHGIRALAERIDPEQPLYRLTADEIEALCGSDKGTKALVLGMRHEVELSEAQREIRALLAARFVGGPVERGPHERRRGRRLAVELIGMGVGLGLAPTRAQSSARHSASDAALAAYRRPSRSLDPVAVAVYYEIPSGYSGMEHLWLDALKDPDLQRCAAIGRRLGAKRAAEGSKLTI